MPRDLSNVPTNELLDEIRRRFDRLEASQPRAQYTLQEVATILGQSKYTVQRWCREGMPVEGEGKVEITYKKVGRQYVMTGEELARIQTLRS